MTAATGRSVVRACARENLRYDLKRVTRDGLCHKIFFLSTLLCRVIFCCFTYGLKVS